MTDVSIDVETKSATLDVKEVGAERYAEEADVICVAFKIGDHERLWTPGEPCPFKGDLSNYRFHAFNASFERAIWREVLVKKYDWPETDICQWYCTSARSLANGLPAALGKSAAALDLENKKDSDGHKVMMKLTKPRKPTKKDPRLWFDDLELFEKCYDYCQQDVRVEAEIQKYTYPLTDKQRRNYQLSEEINDAGIPVDLDAVNKALPLLLEHKGRLEKRLQKLTGGMVKTARSTKKLKEWLCWVQGESVDIDASLDKHRVAELMEEDLKPKTRKVLKIRQELNQSASDKVAKIKKMVCRDRRVHGGHIYHKASTGRFAGSGLQPQNMKRGFKDPHLISTLIKWLDYDYDTFVALLKKHSLGSFSTVLARLVRSFIAASPGMIFYAADFTAIEARILAWLANEKEALQMYYAGEDAYLRMAERIYGAKPGSFNKEDHADERQMGKQAVLGCGYQMGGRIFAATCASYGMDVSEKEGHRIVSIYRKYHPAIAGVRDAKGRVTRDGLWQKTEKAAKRTLLTKKNSWVGKFGFEFVDGDLRMVLPSKRRIFYREAHIKNVETDYGYSKPTIHYWGLDSKTSQWCLQRTYGGKLVENADQGTAADIQIEALRNTREAGYNPVMHVHDEIIGEVRQGFGSVKRMCEIMQRIPDWAKGCPIEAEGTSLYRYQKT